jgi:hypothetical protein
MPVKALAASTILYSEVGKLETLRLHGVPNGTQRFACLS